MKMNRLYWIFLVLLCSAAARPALALDLGVSYAVYNTPNNKPYLEVNFEIAAATLKYNKIENEKIQASAEILILLKKGDNVVSYEKYNLASPPIDVPQGLIDVKRFMVAEGDYDLEVFAQDLNAAENKGHFRASISVHFPDQLTLSEVQLLRNFKKEDAVSPFNKNGYYLEPLPFNFYDRGYNLLAFYGEIYHSNKTITDQNYLVRYFIEQEKGNGIKSLVSSGSQHKKASDIDALLVQMDISKLNSGNYLLTVEARNNANDLLGTRSVSFVRSNPTANLTENELTEEVLKQQFTETLNEKQLHYAMTALSPIVVGDDATTLKNLVRDKDIQGQRYFLYRFFFRTNPIDPERAYSNYIELANEVHEKFKSGFRYGFETDRGRTYIRFGAPDDMLHVEDEAGAPPYEIWVYYNFPKTSQTNVKFLFYNPSLAGDDYIMLHSTARGEIQDPKWERKLYSRNLTEYIDGDNYNDATGVQRNLGHKAKEYFTDF